jgi:hypothetical protein
MDGFHKYCTELPGANCAPHEAAYKHLVSSSRYTGQIVFMTLRKVHIITHQYPQQHLANAITKSTNLSHGLGNYIRLVTDGSISSVKLY